MKILFFSSHTSIWYFAIAEATLAYFLKKKGHEILFVTPGKLFPGISDVKNESILREQFKLDGYEIGNILTDKDYSEIKSRLSRVNRNNFAKLKIDGVDIGKIALYEFLIERKKIDLEFTFDEWKTCLSSIKNTLISFYACRKILSKEKPDRILMYSSLYSVNHAWESYSKVLKIPTYFIHNGLNFADMDNTLIIARKNSFRYVQSLINLWPKYRNIPISKSMLSYITDHFFELLKATHYLVYSSPKSSKKLDIRKRFGIANSQKILTATMSSYDEMFAAEYIGALKKPKKLLFKDQTVWLKTLIKYFKRREDLFLIIRVHPREFPNKREGVKSQHAFLLEKLFKKLPKNVSVNWPKDNISLYDLALETDVFLNAWSTAGVEMSLLGIPVVIYSKELNHYPEDLNYLGENKIEYFRKINLALKNGRSFEIIKRTFRWMALYYWRPIMRIKPRTKIIPVMHGKTYALSFTSYLYKYFPSWAREKVGRTRKEMDCQRQMKEHIDITVLENMLINLDDTMVTGKSRFIEKVSIKNEQKYLENEVRKINKRLNII